MAKMWRVQGGQVVGRYAVNPILNTSYEFLSKLFEEVGQVRGIPLRLSTIPLKLLV